MEGTDRGERVCIGGVWCVCVCVCVCVLLHGADVFV